jgi:hypothetical protein
MKKSIKEIFWDISEPEYRKDPALSQSTLATFERKGFEGLDTLFEPVSSSALTFGSCVDCLITEGEKAFEERYHIADIPKIKPSAGPIIKEIYNLFHNAYTNIQDIPDADIMPVILKNNYQSNWQPKTRVKSIKDEGSRYYQTMFMAKDKTVITQEVYNRVFACVQALKNSEQTRYYFCADNPFDDIERVYQQKVKGKLGKITYRGMPDLLIVNHKDKTVIPCDLKTSSGKEYDFPKHFIEWGYQIQARLYWRLIRQAMDKDEYFKYFQLRDFRFIVVNSNSIPVPLVWIFDGTQTRGDIILGGKVCRDPEKIGEELVYYLTEKPLVPIGINLTRLNSIEQCLRND